MPYEEKMNRVLQEELNGEKHALLEQIGWVERVRSSGTVMAVDVAWGGK